MWHVVSRCTSCQSHQAGNHPILSADKFSRLVSNVSKQVPPDTQAFHSSVTRDLEHGNDSQLTLHIPIHRAHSILETTPPYLRLRLHLETRLFLSHSCATPSTVPTVAETLPETPELACVCHHTSNAPAQHVFHRQSTLRITPVHHDRGRGRIGWRCWHNVRMLPVFECTRTLTHAFSGYTALRYTRRTGTIGYTHRIEFYSHSSYVLVLLPVLEY